MARKTKPRLPRDPYWEVVQSLMQNILTIYEAYRDKKPVMLFDMQEQRIYVYPYLEFKEHKAPCGRTLRMSALSSGASPLHG